MPDFFVRVKAYRLTIEAEVKYTLIYKGGSDIIKTAIDWKAVKMMIKENDIEKVEKISMVEQVFMKLKTMITNGTLQPGDKLPSEAELAEMFGCNRLTIRMALQKLNAGGILETGVGSGTYVKEFSISDFFKEFGDVIFTNINMNEVLGLRKLIEVESCMNAIEKAQPEDKIVLKKRLEEYLEAKKNYLMKKDKDFNSSDFKKLINMDMAFHRQICLCGHNRIYYEIFLIIENLIKLHLIKELKQRIYNERSNEDDNHVIIYRAIIEKDKDRARKAYMSVLEISS